jgi:hypothetical protein
MTPTLDQWTTSRFNALLLIGLLWIMWHNGLCSPAGWLPPAVRI